MNKLADPRVLLVGYNGANNTGAEARLLTIISDVRDVFGPSVLITVPTLNESHLRRYLKEDPRLNIVPISPVFLLDVHRLVRKHDLVLLVEGSCYMDTWTPYLLWAWLWTTRCARAAGKPVIAYAVDAGCLSSSNAPHVKREASKTDLIITRTRAAADRLTALGVSAPIEVTADSAFRFRPEAGVSGLLRKVWPGSERVMGVAPMDFYLWPVVLRLWGPKGRCYRWPYYFSDSLERRSAKKALAVGFAELIDHVVDRHDRRVALLCMEQLDEPLALSIKSLVKNSARVRVFSSRQFNASEMTVLLRSLAELVTSRYHAGVLSLAAHVPQVAVGHDQRLADLYSDLGLYEDYFVQYDRPDLFSVLREKVDSIIDNPSGQLPALVQGNRDGELGAKRNTGLLAKWASERYGLCSHVSEVIK
jgi:polysaccharide pyruvyl transferase WcaK-like protein